MIIIVQRLKDKCACFERLFGHELQSLIDICIKYINRPKSGLL